MTLTATWESTELPVLETVVELFESGSPGIPIQLVSAYAQLGTMLEPAAGQLRAMARTKEPAMA